MSEDLSKIKAALELYGITDATEIVHNPTYEQLFNEEVKPELEGFEKGVETELGAVNVMTGIFTGRSPKDKYIVLDDKTRDTVWWAEQAKTSDNKPVGQEEWKHCYRIGAEELCGKRLFVVDGYAGANENTRMKVRFIMEVAWQAHFVKNMFIMPSEEELLDFEPDFVVLNAAKATNPDWKTMKRSDL